jgi:hypothetical protein
MFFFRTLDLLDKKLMTAASALDITITVMYSRWEKENNTEFW